MQSVSVNGVTLHCQAKGRAGARTLIFLNSLGTDFRIWDKVADELSADCHIVLYDKRGHGLSDLPDGPLTMGDHVGDLIGLIEHLDCGSVVLCGLSVGGQIALGACGRRPDLFEGLILMDTAHKIGTEDMWNARIERVRGEGIAALSDGILERWFTDGFRDNRHDFPLYRAMLERTPVAGYAGTCEALRDSDFTDVARAVDVPTLLLVGDRDGATPPDLVRSTADLIEGSRLEIIADAGHLPNVEQPETVVRHIRSFLLQLEGEVA